MLLTWGAPCVTDLNGPGALRVEGVSSEVVVAGGVDVLFVRLCEETPPALHCNRKHQWEVKRWF